MKPGERLEWNMTRDESLVFGSTMSDFKFLLEHEVSVLEIALAAVSFEDCSLDGSVPLDRVVVAYDYWLGALDALSVFRIWNFRTTTCLVVCCRLCCSMMVVPAGSYVPWLPW